MLRGHEGVKLRGKIITSVYAVLVTVRYGRGKIDRGLIRAVEYPYNSNICICTYLSPLEDNH